MATFNEETLQIELTAEDKEALSMEEPTPCELCEGTGKIEDEDGFVKKCKVCADCGEGHNSQE
jgi:DnaJ-class molecular chaperone